MKTKQQEDSESRAAVEVAVTVKVGLDVHAEQVTVVKQEEACLPKPAFRSVESALVAKVADWVRAGQRVYCCYEAGPCGYGLHRALLGAGAINYVVAPQRWDERGKRVKTDRSDAQELCQRLDRYVGGNRKVFSVVHVPTPEEEQRRALCRQRGAVLKERNRSIVRARSLLLSQGIRAPQQWWTSREWKEFAPSLPSWLREHVQFWQTQACSLERQLKGLTAQVEQLSAGQILPKGLGALTHALLENEVLTWTRFNNRRQVGSYTGLCPSEASSGPRRRQGAINKSGNPRIRHYLVEAVWRLLYWQPNYKPLIPLRTATSTRQRKRLVVAAARRLAIDLWRINTGQCSAQKLGLIVEPQR